MKRIAILTAGGDTPALNATIYGAVVRANQLKVEVVGLIKGFNCLFNPRVPHVTLKSIAQNPDIAKDFTDPSTATLSDIQASHPDHLAAGEAAIQSVYPDARNPFAHGATASATTADCCICDDAVVISDTDRKSVV